MGMRASCRRTVRRRPETGAVAVEFALVAPMLILLVLGIIDFGYMLNRDTMINNTSRDAARVASLGGTYAQVLATAQSELAGAGIPAGSPATTIAIDCVKPDGMDCNATSSTFDSLAGSGAVATVKITYKYSWLTPSMSALLGSTLTLTKQTQMRIE